MAGTPKFFSWVLGGAVAACAVLDADPIDHSPTTRPAIQTLTESRAGQDLVGKPMPALRFDRWLNVEKHGAPDLRNSVVLYRWWTDTCPYCARTLPAIEKLRTTFGSEGLKVVAVYHPKPPRKVPDDAVLAAAKAVGYHGAIAIDADWAQLNRVWLSTGRREATSVSFLVDAQGVIRFVHPGVEYFPSDNPREKQQDEDFRLLENAIHALLRQPPPAATAPARPDKHAAAIPSGCG